MSHDTISQLEAEILRDDITNARSYFGESPLHRFIKTFWSEVEPESTYLDNWHVGAKCEHLEAVGRNEIKNLVISEPPGFMKSVTANIMWPAFHWATVRPSHKWFHGSHDITLMHRDARRMLDLLVTPRFRAIYPEFTLGTTSTRAVGQFTNGHGGWRMASTPKARGIGWHFHFMVIDDPIKPSDLRGGVVDPKALRDADVWIRQTLGGRHADPKNFHRVLVMQRLHEQDPAGTMLQEDGWEHLCIPMRYDPKAFSYGPNPNKEGWDRGSSLGGARAFDPRTEEGALAWEERFPEDVVEHKEKEMMPADCSAQHQQNPVPAEGNVIKESFFQFRSTAEVPPHQGKYVIQVWDFGFKGTDRSHSRSVGALWMGDDAGGFDWVDCVYGIVDYTAAKEMFRSAQLRPGWSLAKSKYIESKANGPAVEADLKDEFSGITLWDPGKDDKLTRMLPHLDVWINRQVRLPPRAVHWVDEAIREITRFPRYGKDDIWDTTSMALTILRGGSAQYFQALRAAKPALKHLQYVLGNGDGRG